jgi:transcriptional regulator with XRE-family HTH domain
VAQKNEKFGRALRLLRGEQSQAEFVRRLGFLTQSAYAKYEMGRVPKVPILEKLSRCLGISADNLLQGRLPHPVVPMNEGLLFDRWLKALSLEQLREITDWLHQYQRHSDSAVVQSFLSTAIGITHQHIAQLVLEEEPGHNARSTSAGSSETGSD